MNTGMVVGCEFTVCPICPIEKGELGARVIDQIDTDASETPTP